MVVLGFVEVAICNVKTTTQDTWDHVMHRLNPDGNELSGVIGASVLSTGEVGSVSLVRKSL